MEVSSKLELSQSKIPPIECQGCGEPHYYNNSPFRKKIEQYFNIQEDSIVGEVTKSILRIHTALEDRQAEYQPTMIELGKLYNHVVTILIDPEEILHYINPKVR